MKQLENFSESIADLLVATLCSGRSSRRFNSILRERKFNRQNKNSVRTSLYRLQSNGYIKATNAAWAVTQKGRKYFQKKHLLGYLPSPFLKNAEHKTIIAFDIPENNRIVRTWLRNQIKIFGYTMLQQSLWIGPGPLPSSFLERLEELNIRKNVKTFKISKINT